MSENLRALRKSSDPLPRGSYKSLISIASLSIFFENVGFNYIYFKLFYGGKSTGFDGPCVGGPHR